MRRRLLLVTAVVLAPILVLGVEALIARTGTRLADEQGFRPVDLVVRSGTGSAPISVVWLGDSTSTGVGTDAIEQSMAYRVTEDLTSSAATLTIIGMSGAQVHEVLADQLDELRRLVDAAMAPDVVFVSIGANDVTALTRRPTFRDRYRSMVDQIIELAPDAELVLVGIPDMGTAPRLPVPLRQVAGLRAGQLDTDIANVAADRDLHHVDLADRTSGTFSSDPDRFFSADDFHPSADGHEVWGDAVVASIESSGGLAVAGD